MIVLGLYPHQRRRRETVRKRHSAGRRAVPNLEGCRSTAMTSGKAEAHVGANESSCCSMNDTKLRFLRGSDNETKSPNRKQKKRLSARRAYGPVTRNQAKSA